MKKVLLQLLSAAAVLFAGVVTLSAQGLSPQYLKPSNMGTEFYFTFLPCYEESGNNKLMLYISSIDTGTAVIEVVGKGYSKKVTLKAFDPVGVEIGPGFGQAISKSVNGSFPPEQVYPQSALHITSTVPVIVYGVTRFNYTSDSFLALPVEALGTSYVVSSMADMTWMYGGYSLPSEAGIVAAYDHTTVHFTLGGPSVTVTGGGMKPGQTKGFTMNKGDVWLIGNDANSKEGDMTGSVITADKPIAVFGGNQCANVPTTMRWCDYICEQERPMENWGRTYLVPKYATRAKSYYVKVISGSTQCNVTLDGAPWHTFTTIGGPESTGWTQGFINSASNTVACLQSGDPFNVVVFNPGQEVDGVSTDPFQMNIIPYEQFAKAYMFSTPGTKGGLGFTRNYMGVIFPVVNGAIPDDLEYGVSVNGTISWRKFSSVFGSAFNTFDIYQSQMPNGYYYAFKECALPADGDYFMRGSVPFAIYSYGGGDYDSYGHPVGGLNIDLQKMQDVSKPVALVTKDSLGLVGTIEDMPKDVTIRSNLSKVNLARVSTNAKISVDKINGKSVSIVNWRLDPIDPELDMTADVAVTDRAGNDTVYHYTLVGHSQPPVITNTTKDSLCVNKTATLKANAGYTKYLWSTGDTTQSATITSSVPGLKTYTVTVTSRTGKVMTSDGYALYFVDNPAKATISQNINHLKASVTGATYQWYLNDQAISGATTDTYVISASGMYSVDVTNSFGCTTRSESFSAVALDVADAENDGLSLQPSPATSNCTLRYQNLHPKHVELVDMEGKVLLRYEAQQLGNDALNIPLQNIAAGSYIVRVWINNEIHSLRLVKN